MNLIISKVELEKLINDYHEAWQDKTQIQNRFLLDDGVHCCAVGALIIYYEAVDLESLNDTHPEVRKYFPSDIYDKLLTHYNSNWYNTYIFTHIHDLNVRFIMSELNDAPHSYSFEQIENVLRFALSCYED